MENELSLIFDNFSIPSPPPSRDTCKCIDKEKFVYHTKDTYMYVRQSKNFHFDYNEQQHRFTALKALLINKRSI